jgi:hypothetical protein
MEKKDEERAIEMTGGTAANLSEALDQWDNEREMIGQLHDENQAYTIAFRRFDLAMSMASKVISQVEQDAGLFITEKTRSEIQQFRDQVAKLQTTRTIAHEIKEVSTERKKPNAKQTHTNPRGSTRRRKPGKGSP